MQPSPSRAWGRHSLAFAALALAAVGAACAVESPERSTGPRAAAAGAAAAAANAPAFVEFDIDEPATPAGPLGLHYPPGFAAAGTGGRVDVQFVVDTAGRVEPGSVKVLRATHPEFAEAVRAAVPGVPFRPARTRGRAVQQLLQLPISFTPDP